MEVNKILNCDVLKGLKQLPNESIDCIVTSPPYWGLRDYGVEGQLGLEPTLQEFINKLLKVTYELKRVLKKSGVMFWNHGDSYASSGSIGGRFGDEGTTSKISKKTLGAQGRCRTDVVPQKCMVMQNYRLILRMIDEQGWILRNTIIWHKPNSMPSSVKDRFSNSYEPVYMLVKNKKYWFDLDAVRVPHKENTVERRFYGNSDSRKKGMNAWRFQNKTNYLNPAGKNPGDVWDIGAETRPKSKLGVPSRFGTGNKHPSKDPRWKHPRGKNPSDLWTISTQPFKEAHFAVFPEKLVKPMILAGCPREVCKVCGHVRTRIIERIRPDTYNPSSQDLRNKGRGSMSRHRPIKEIFRDVGISKTVGWTDCNCKEEGKYLPGVVLDPFAGAGTTLKVAQDLGRKWIGIELNPEYIKIIKKRLHLNEQLNKFIIQ